MDIQKELESFKIVAIAKGWSIDGETTQTNYRFYSLTTNSGWEVWQVAKAQAVPVEKNWDEIHLNPKERLYWSLRTTKKRKSDLNWHHASHQTCVGSTHGRKICEYLGVDPDSTDFARTQEPAND